MKAILVTVGLLVAATALRAQPVFVLDPDHSFGGYVGPSLRMGSLFHQPAHLAGGGTGIVVDHRLVVGVEGTTLYSNVIVHPWPGARGSLRLLYGGLLVAYRLAPERPVTAVVRASVGGGGVRTVGIASAFAPLILSIDMPVDGPDDAFFLFEPGVGLEADVGALLKVELSLLYRVVAGVATEGITNGDVSGASLALTAKVGVF
jgi:hypothetical protein